MSDLVLEKTGQGLLITHRGPKGEVRAWIVRRSEQNHRYFRALELIGGSEEKDVGPRFRRQSKAVEHIAGLVKADAPLVIPAKKGKPKKESRAQRWSRAAQTALDALEELKEIQQEFESWKDNLPDSLSSSPLGEKLETICEIDLESARDAAQEAVDAEVPLGFGRD